MDLYRIINELLEERDRVNRIIESLESMSEDGAVVKKPRKRGRKRMDASARRSVSVRMKQYWAKRRASAQADQK